jgi:hypothetical protein
MIANPLTSQIWKQKNTHTKEVKIDGWKVGRWSRKAIYIPTGVLHVQPSILLISWQQIIWNVGKIKEQGETCLHLKSYTQVNKLTRKYMKLKVTWKDAKNHQHHQLSSTSWHHHRWSVFSQCNSVSNLEKKWHKHVDLWSYSYAIKAVRPNHICQVLRHYGTNCHVIGKKVTKEFQRYSRPHLMLILEIC